MRPLLRSLPVLLVCCGLLAVSGLKVNDPPGKQMQVFAESFLATLDADQKAQATMPYDSPQRVDWHFIPKKSRKGLMIGEMNSAQRTAALRLVRAALSEMGYDKASKIMLLEGVIREMEGADRTWARDPEMYYVTIFGKPSGQEPWGLSFEGHHLSLNFVCRDGEMVDSTPQFMGTNPAVIMSEVEGPLSKGTRVLRDEEVLAFELVQSLSDEQSDSAIIAEEAPAEIRFAGEPQVEVGEPEGIAFSELDSDQQKRLKELVGVYVNAVADQEAEERHQMIQNNGWEDVHFAWAGATEPGIGHYYRVRGKEFLIELVNTQPGAEGNPANHVHAVWRDLTGDFNLPAK